MANEISSHTQFNSITGMQGNESLPAKYEK